MSQLAATMSAPAKTQRFYVAMAAACVAVAFVGFAPTYWWPIVTGTGHQTGLVHLHGMLFFGWTLFYWLQTSLVASGRTAMHRELGLAGIALAAMMLCIGMLVSIQSMHLNAALGAEAAAKSFSIVSISAIVLFAALVGVAIANTRNPELHKRLMLIATVSMLQAAIARWFLLALRPPDAIGPPPVVVSVAPGLVADLLIVVAMLHDRKTRGSVHRAYWIAGGAVLAVQLLRVPLSQTTAWLAIADWLASASL